MYLLLIFKNIYYIFFFLIGQKIYVTTLPVALTTHQMFVNDYRRVRARNPNIGKGD